MPWARIDDSLYDHPKLDCLGKHRLAGVGLMTLALSWSNRFLTDGSIPTDRVTRLGGTIRLAEELCQAGLWEHVDGGYRIHDFFAYSKSRDRVLREREAARDRQASSRGMSQRDIERSHSEVTRAPSRPVPDTRNDGERNGTKRAPVPIGEVMRVALERAKA